MRVEYQRSACDDRAAAAAHSIVDLQRAAVRCFQYAVVGDGVARIERERAAGDIGVDRAVRLVDQRQIAVAGADLAGAGDGVIDVRQRAGRSRANDDVASPDIVTWPPP